MYISCVEASMPAINPLYDTRYLWGSRGRQVNTADMQVQGRTRLGGSVDKYLRTLFLAWMSAPRSRRISMARRWSTLAAKWSTVFRSYWRHEGILDSDSWNGKFSYYIHRKKCMYVYSYIILGIDIGSSVDKQSHHLRAFKVSSCYQGSTPFILSDTNTDTYSFLHSLKHSNTMKTTWWKLSICVPFPLHRCLPPNPEGSRPPKGFHFEQPSKVRYILPMRDNMRQNSKRGAVNGI